jgi:hypothetical protein
MRFDAAVLERSLDQALRSTSFADRLQRALDSASAAPAAPAPVPAETEDAMPTKWHGSVVRDIETKLVESVLMAPVDGDGDTFSMVPVRDLQGFMVAFDVTRFAGAGAVT